MDFYETLRAFITLCEAGSFSKAARKLFLSQPTLSQRIQRLESFLGYSLISRQRGKLSIELTEEGTAFLAIANQILELMDEACSIGGVAATKPLKLSITETIMTCTMPNVLTRFMERNPNQPISIHSYYSQESYDLVQDGKLDLAVVSLQFPHSPIVNVQPLMKEDWLFVCGPNSDYPDIIESPKDLSEEKLLILCNIDRTSWYKHWMNTSASHTFEGFTCTILNSNSNIFSNNHWAILPKSVALEYIAKGICVPKQLKILPEPRCIYAVYRDDNEYPSLIDEFIDCAKEELRISSPRTDAVIL